MLHELKPVDFWPCFALTKQPGYLLKITGLLF